MALLPVLPFENGIQQLFTQVFHKQTPVSNTTPGEQGGINKNLDFRLFSEVYQKVAENYYGFESISEKDLVSGMIKGFIEALGDKHSEYFNTEETKKFNEVLAGDFEGIGAVIEKNDFGVAVERIIAGSPAKESGILSGDIIIKANGEELKDVTLTDAVAKIRGPADTVVELEIVR
ncbi:MAG: PDZ domain-containing protein, partial [Candidatus Gracilibacteria bacterium]|nr:PDZ domain-containing protein [Candidatus Gracilibacteria bacterium]